MERRIPQKQVEIPGAFLTRLTTDGYSVAYRYEYIGYLHASVGDRFNVYQRKVDEMEYRLGKNKLEDSMEAIWVTCMQTIDQGGFNVA